MEFLMRLFLILLSVVYASSAFSQVRWVDENGSVHFGDRAPAEYQATAEEVAIEPALLPGNTPEEINKMRIDNARLKHLAR